MKKTLINNFDVTMENGKLVLTQRCSDVKAAINIILDMEVTSEEFDILYKAVQILRRYEN